MILVFVFYFIFTMIVSLNSQNIGSKLDTYFSSDDYNSFQKYWQAHRKSFESALVLALKENYGNRDMNLYVRRADDNLKLSDGFYVSDNVVDLLLFGLYLKFIPNLLNAEVVFALASNVLQVELDLRKMIIETTYIVIRNSSNLHLSGEEDPYKTSPFNYQQVQFKGHLAIVAERCVLSGYSVVKLSGNSADLGYDSFKVTGCQFRVEISSEDGKSPSVNAPYFGKSHSRTLEKLISRPVVQEIKSILQACMFSYLNTSIIFGTYLDTYYEKQNELFKQSIKHVRGLVRWANKETVKKDLTAIPLPSFSVSWNLTFNRGSTWNYVSAHNVTLYGLDSLYSAHDGGPYKLKEVKMAETLRFNSIIVRGNLYFENNTVKADNDFVAEIKDVQINFEAPRTGQATLEVMTCRTFEMSVVELDLYVHERRAATAFINGYLINTVPKALETHLSETLLQGQGDDLLNQELDNLQDNVSDNKELPNGQDENKGKENVQESADDKEKSGADADKALLLLAAASILANKKNRGIKDNIALTSIESRGINYNAVSSDYQDERRSISKVRKEKKKTEMQITPKKHNSSNKKTKRLNKF